MHLTRLCYYIILLGENIVQCVRGLGFESWSGHLGMCTLRQYSSILYRELELERFSQHVFPSRSMLVICCNPDLVLLQGTLTMEAHYIWCSVLRQVKDTAHGVNVQPAVDSQPRKLNRDCSLLWLSYLVIKGMHPKSNQVKSIRTQNAMCY